MTPAAAPKERIDGDGEAALQQAIMQLNALGAIVMMIAHRQSSLVACDKALVLRNDQDQEVTIPLKDVEEQSPSKVSLMPDGLTDTLTRGELVDLVSYLAALGKRDGWSIGKDKVARRWQSHSTVLR